LLGLAFVNTGLKTFINPMLWHWDENEHEIFDLSQSFVHKLSLG
jgi:hypothetical protein